MYIIVSAARPGHCQPACILPVSKLPGTWREKLRAITEPPLRGGCGVFPSSHTAARFSLHGDSPLTSGMLLTPFNVHFQIQNASFHIWNGFQWAEQHWRPALVTKRKHRAHTHSYARTQVWVSWSCSHIWPWGVKYRQRVISCFIVLRKTAWQLVKKLRIIPPNLTDLNTILRLSSKMETNSV